MSNWSDSTDEKRRDAEDSRSERQADEEPLPTRQTSRQRVRGKQTDAAGRQRQR